MNTETSVNSFKSGAFWKRSFSPKTSENEGFWKRWPKHSFHIYSIYFSLRFRWSVNVEERRKCIEMCVSSLNTLFCAVKIETNTSVAKNIFFLFVGHKNLLFWDRLVCSGRNGQGIFFVFNIIRILKSGSEIVKVWSTSQQMLLLFILLLTQPRFKAVLKLIAFQRKVFQLFWNDLTCAYGTFHCSFVSCWNN